MNRILHYFLFSIVALLSVQLRAANFREIQKAEKVVVSVAHKIIDDGKPLFFHVGIRDSEGKFSSVFKPCKIAVTVQKRESNRVDDKNYVFVESNRISLDWGITSVSSSILPEGPGIYRVQVGGGTCKLEPAWFMFGVRESLKAVEGLAE